MTHLITVVKTLRQISRGKATAEDLAQALHAAGFTVDDNSAVWTSGIARLSVRVDGHTLETTGPVESVLAEVLIWAVGRMAERAIKPLVDRVVDLIVGSLVVSWGVERRPSAPSGGKNGKYRPTNTPANAQGDLE